MANLIIKEVAINALFLIYALINHLILFNFLRQRFMPLINIHLFLDRPKHLNSCITNINLIGEMYGI
jgi:hypothetical protein